MHSTNNLFKQQHVNFVKFSCNKHPLGITSSPFYSIQTKNERQTLSRTEKTACKCFPHRLESKLFLSLPFMLSCRRMHCLLFLLIQDKQHSRIKTIPVIYSNKALSALSTNVLTVFMRQNNLIFDTRKSRALRLSSAVGIVA